jgi:hypothetical protein
MGFAIGIPLSISFTYPARSLGRLPVTGLAQDTVWLLVSSSKAFSVSSWLAYMLPLQLLPMLRAS